MKTEKLTLKKYNQIISANDVKLLCPICRQKDQTLFRIYVNHGKEDSTTLGVHDVFICKTCQFLQNPGNSSKDLNPVDYTAKRLGTSKNTGREYLFTKEAATIFEKLMLNILVYGAGVSLDYTHIRQLDFVNSCWIADLENYSNDNLFIDVKTDKLKMPQFDIVIASEVIEHFEDPISHFSNLLNFVDNDGICVCGSNFVGGMPVSRLEYPYFKGHVCMWSESSIQRIAKIKGFKAIIFLSSVGGSRKRIIVMTKSENKYLKLLLKFEKNKNFI